MIRSRSSSGSSWSGLGWRPALGWRARTHLALASGLSRERDTRVVGSLAVASGVRIHVRAGFPSFRQSCRSMARRLASEDAGEAASGPRKSCIRSAPSLERPPRALRRTANRMPVDALGGEVRRLAGRAWVTRAGASRLRDRAPSVSRHRDTSAAAALEHVSPAAAGPDDRQQRVFAEGRRTLRRVHRHITGYPPSARGVIRCRRPTGASWHQCC